MIIVENSRLVCNGLCFIGYLLVQISVFDAISLIVLPFVSYIYTKLPPLKCFVVSQKRTKLHNVLHGIYYY